MKEEHEQWKEAHKKEEKKEMQHCNRVNESFEEIPRFNESIHFFLYDFLLFFSHWIWSYKEWCFILQL